ncbi:MAG: hypothetical protein HC819_04720 [Cyclobacteriaceae bacterium]|nr:hypothetical protein [Cyclobacteriaceae bacterium]
MKRTFLFITLSLLNFQVFAQQDSIFTRHYEIQYGTNPNIESGSQSVIGISSLIFDQTSLLIKNKVKSKSANLFARIGNFGLVQFYFGAQLYATIPHEYFGHYLRAREFGVTPKLNLDFPSLGGDNVFIVSQNMPVLQRQMIVAAGPEVTATIAYHATQQLYSAEYSPNYLGNYLLAGKIIDQYIYLQNNVKPFLENPNKYYTQNAEYFSRNPVPNDPVSYVLALTESYGYYDAFLDDNATWVQKLPDMSVYTQNEFINDQYSRMKYAYLLTALDPTNLYFIYGTLLYLVKGQTFYKPFMLTVKNVSFMPSVRANMGENGIENYFDMFFRVKKMPAFSVYYRTGGNMFHQTKGFGTEFRNLILTDRIRINGQFDYWNNERTETNNINIQTGIGLADKSNLFSMNGNIGYKSYGNLMGKPFSEGIYVYFGLGMNLQYEKN